MCKTTNSTEEHNCLPKNTLIHKDYNILHLLKKKKKRAPGPFSSFLPVFGRHTSALFIFSGRGSELLSHWSDEQKRILSSSLHRCSRPKFWKKPNITLCRFFAKWVNLWVISSLAREIGGNINLSSSTSLACKLVMQRRLWVFCLLVFVSRGLTEFLMLPSTDGWSSAVSGGQCWVVVKRKEMHIFSGIELSKSGEWIG